MFGHFLHLGFWPLIMGITMWVQMKLNPAPPDPTQKMIFDWMPLIFTFMLASFSAGLVIYWAWNNTLSVLQQSIIMRKNGAKIELFDNIKSLFAKKKRRTTRPSARGASAYKNGRESARPFSFRSTGSPAEPDYAGGVPMKSRLPTSTPHCRMMS